MWTHKGHTITITSIGEFEVAEGPKCHSLENAEKAIDRMVSARVKRKVSNLGLAVVSSGGEHRTIRGIHMGTGKPLYAEEGLKRDSYHLSELYPDVPWLVATIEEMNAASLREHHLRERVQKYQLMRNRGQQPNIEWVEEHLVNEYNARKKSAEESPEAEAWEGSEV